jgi:hypothetical protein
MEKVKTIAGNINIYEISGERMKTRLPRHKWVHPLKGRSIKEVMADALDKAAPGTIFQDDCFWQNSAALILWKGCASWGYIYCRPHPLNPIHSWDSMKDCLKYGFDVGEDGCCVARDNDWNQKQKLKKKE